MPTEKNIKKFSKNYCGTCSLDGDCYCQNKSQKSVNSCGIEKVVEQNRELRKKSQTYDNPDYTDFMNERW